ncbi:hypothetical protein RB595_009448 [Gaeumannomyces hyphopodioides]
MDADKAYGQSAGFRRLDASTLSRLPSTTNVTNYIRKDQNFEKVLLGIAARGQPAQGVPAHGTGRYYPAQISARDLADNVSKI